MSASGKNGVQSFIYPETPISIIELFRIKNQKHKSKSQHKKRQVTNIDHLPEIKAAVWYLPCLLIAICIFTIKLFTNLCF